VKTEFLLFLGALLISAGCGGWLQKACDTAKSIDYATTVADVAEAGAAAFFARNPNQTRLSTVNAALTAFRAATEAIGNGCGYRDQAVKSYSKAWGLLREYGVLDGKGQGGAESSSPLPGPLVLPTPVEMSGSL
jgi:hypothetical protein